MRKIKAMFSHPTACTEKTEQIKNTNNKKINVASLHFQNCKLQVHNIPVADTDYSPINRKIKVLQIGRAHV